MEEENEKVGADHIKDLFGMGKKTDQQVIPMEPEVLWHALSTMKPSTRAMVLGMLIDLIEKGVEARIVASDLEEGRGVLRQLLAAVAFQAGGDITLGEDLIADGVAYSLDIFPLEGTRTLRVLSRKVD